MKKIDKLSWNTQIIDPSTGAPTAFFVLLWQTLLEKVELISFPDNPVDGATLTLTYNADTKKWIGS